MGNKLQETLVKRAITDALKTERNRFHRNSQCDPEFEIGYDMDGAVIMKYDVECINNIARELNIDATDLDKTAFLTTSFITMSKEDANNIYEMLGKVLGEDDTYEKWGDKGISFERLYDALDQRLKPVERIIDLSSRGEK